jgi:hypothetical protein
VATPGPAEVEPALCGRLFGVAQKLGPEYGILHRQPDDLADLESVEPGDGLPCLFGDIRLRIQVHHPVELPDGARDIALLLKQHRPLEVIAGIGGIQMNELVRHLQSLVQLPELQIRHPHDVPGIQVSGRKLQQRLAAVDSAAVFPSLQVELQQELPGIHVAFGVLDRTGCQADGLLQVALRAAHPRQLQENARVGRVHLQRLLQAARRGIQQPPGCQHFRPARKR